VTLLGPPIVTGTPVDANTQGVQQISSSGGIIAGLMSERGRESEISPILKASTPPESRGD
jgi:hypothetical protein